MNRARREDAARRCRESAFLTAGLARWPDLCPLFLTDGSEAALSWARQSEPELAVPSDLRRQRDRLAVALALGDLSGELGFERVAATLADFADEACERALRHAVAANVPGWSGGEVPGFVVLALGKHGGRELNYSSDIDPILLYDPATLPSRGGRDPQRGADRIARAWVETLQARDADGYVFRVDLRLRPTPEVSPPALPIDGAIAHYEGAALPWERAAMVRARVAAGDRALGAHFLREIRPFVWRRSLDFGAAAELSGMAARIRQAAGDRATAAPGGDLKRGRGGIRSAEFFVQAHQLVHGGRDPNLRAPNLLDALDALVAADRIDAAAGARLAAGYRRLRTVEHRLQMMDDRQTHSLPTAPEALDAVAHLDGLADGAALLASLADPVGDIAALFAELDSTPTNRLPLDSSQLTGRLGQAGFADADAASRTIASWRAGSAPTLRSAAAQDALEEVLPTLVDGLGAAADPQAALHRLDDVVRRVPSAVGLFRLLSANPAMARVLADIMAAAPALADRLAARPQTLDRLLDASAFDEPLSADELSARWRAELNPLPYERALDGLRDRVGEERFGIGVQAVLGTRPVADLSRGSAAVAQAAARVGQELATREFEGTHGAIDGASLVLVGLGRLGGDEMTHASDLDLVFLHGTGGAARSDGPRRHDRATYFNRLGQRVIAALSVPTATGPLYEVDVRLRPSGAQGPLVPSIDAFGRYARDDAWTWERMAFCRARVLTGLVEDRAAADSAIGDMVRGGGSKDSIRADALAMRARMDQAKPPAGPLDLKHLPGGLIDLEFLIHVEQLIGAGPVRPQLGPALVELVAVHRLPASLIAAHRLMTDALFLLRLTAPGGDEPAAAGRERMARGCDRPDWPTLVADLAQARRTVRAVWSERFGAPREQRIG